MALPEKELDITRASLDLLYHVSREFTSALDLRVVLQRILLLSMQSVGAINGSIIILDDHGNPVDSAIVVGKEVQEGTTHRLRETLKRGLAGWVVQNHRAALITNTSEDERWLRRRYDHEDETGSKSAVSAPILVRENLVGVITLVHPQSGFFNETHLTLVQTIADQAGIAVSNARLYADSQHQARVMSALAESAKVITASLELGDVLRRILEQISLALNVRTIALALIDAEKGELVYRAALGWMNPLESEKRVKLGQGVAGWVAREGQGLIVHNVHHDNRFDAEIEHRVGFPVESIACAPISYQSVVIGVIEAINPVEGVFDPDTLFILAGIGSLAGTAIRNAQLFDRLQAAHRSYLELFEDSIDSILISNWDGQILEVNRQAARASGFQKDELLSMTVGQLHSLPNEKLGDKFVYLKSGETISYEAELLKRKGVKLPVEVYVRQVRNDQEINLQWIMRDITERKNLDQLRDDLISMIYHDLRSPLANVVSSLDVIHTMLPTETEEEVKPLLDIAIRSTERIQRLTDSLLDMGQLEAGQPIGNRQLVDPTGTVMEAVEIIMPVIRARKQFLDIALPVELPQVFVDIDMIRRVITNLLENAAKYTPADGKIQVGAVQKDEWVQIWVQDDGQGISPDDQERIFDKYNRLTAEGGPKGLGIGLAYCRLAVQGHGGRIWVESAPGTGSRFVFKLPIAQEAS